jgi:hypothetical protein
LDAACSTLSNTGDRGRLLLLLLLLLTMPMLLLFLQHRGLLLLLLLLLVVERAVGRLNVCITGGLAWPSVPCPM